MALPYQLFSRQLSDTSIVLFADGLGPVDAQLLRYNSTDQTYSIDEGTVSDITEDNGITISGLTPGETYIWILQDNGNSEYSNPIQTALINTISSATIEATFVKTQNTSTERYEFTLTITSQVNIGTTKILNIQRLTDGSDEFHSISQPVHISEFPEDAPGPNDSFWRTNTWNFSYEGLEEARAAVTRIKQDLDWTAINWAYLTEFNFQTEVVDHPRS